MQYNNVALPAPRPTMVWLLSARPAIHSPERCRVWDPNVQPAITQQWNWHSPAPVRQQHDPGRLCGPARDPSDGSHALPAEAVSAEQRLRTPPCTAPSIFFSGNPALQSDISQISGTASVGSMNYHALQAVFQKRIQRLAISGGVHAFPVHDRQQRVLRQLGSAGTPRTRITRTCTTREADWATCFFDAKHSSAATRFMKSRSVAARSLATIPIGRLDAVAGGWSIAPIFSIHSGFPLALYVRYGFHGNQFARLRPDCGSGAGKIFGRQTAIIGGKYIGYLWFDPTPYSAASCRHLWKLPGSGSGPRSRLWRRRSEPAEELRLHRESEAAVPVGFPQCLQPGEPEQSLRHRSGHEHGAGQQFAIPARDPICPEALLLTAV